MMGQIPLKIHIGEKLFLVLIAEAFVMHLTGTVLVVGVGVADLFAVRGEEYGFDFVGWPL
ncbi:MAG: hypothetical protein DRP70_16255 [Spirochaetes bacterium]|nr:MAG: hypothetical protein DRP70_16255 [Spirochaetota bacterium]RKX93234.1 MAG: hypothetical protein DRZ90_13040 [Spirochaetota bacterium]